MGLTTISYNPKACRDVYRQLMDIIGDKVAIRSLSYTELLPGEQVKDDLILITTPVIEHLVKPFIKTGCRIVIAKRTINPSCMKALFEIPAGARVLAVNVLYESAVDLVEELQMIGITHARFVPYDPDKPLQEAYALAVTPGEPQLAPREIPRVIDIGDRLISIATISQILFHLTGRWVDDTLINSRYIQNYVKLSMQLSEHSRYSQMLHRQIETVISNFEDGVIVTDKNNLITYHNVRALELLEEKELCGKSLDQYLVVADGFEDSFISVKQKSLHLTRKAINIAQGGKSEMVIIKNLTDIRNIDEQYRKQKKYSGYSARYRFTDIVHRSKAMQVLIKTAAALAETASTVLMIGESGTGKELFAQSIHNASTRCGRPFVALNCAALPETLLESELFGYEDGAFSGARKGGKRGLFEMAHTGTIFLDEVGDAPLSIQKKLLRVLQEKEMMRLGGDQVVPVDVRIIAATNRNLAELVASKQFREDLFYRLNVFPLRIPPLRERRQDVRVLLDYFLQKYAILHRKSLPKLEAPVYDLLSSHDWPGNVRQLENIAEFIVTISSVSDNLLQDILQPLSMSSPAMKAAACPEDYSPGLTRQFTAILQFLKAKKTDERLGRTSLCKKLAERGIHLTEEQVKARLKSLQKQGLVVAFAGKGSSITESGLRHLERIAREEREGEMPSVEGWQAGA